MTQKGVEIALGRLVTDEAIRRSFKEEPRLVLRELIALGVELSDPECAALAALQPSAVQAFAQALDARLQRAILVERGPALCVTGRDGQAP